MDFNFLSLICYLSGAIPIASFCLLHSEEMSKISHNKIFIKFYRIDPIVSFCLLMTYLFVWAVFWNVFFN